MTKSSDVSHASGSDVERVAYVDTFFRELSPVWLGYVAALRGVAACRLDAPFTYIELGCGLGQSVTVNAGAFPRGEFHACDISAVQLQAARAYATALGIENLQFHEASFQDLLARDLPPFDFIVLHGVYSWVDAEARSAIRQFVERKLKPNGLLYLSYNCLPGWAPEAPLRRMLVELATTGEGTLTERAARGLQKLRRLSDANTGYFNVHASTRNAIGTYAGQPTEYLVHEFLTRSWQPFYSIDVADEMAAVGLRCIGSATLVDNHDALMMDARTLAAIADLDTPRERELAADFAVNRYFRRDVFVRSAAVTGDAYRLGAVAVGCVESAESIGHQIKVPRGAISFQRAFIAELRQAMVRGSMSIEDLVSELHSNAGRNTIEIVRNLTFLIAAGVLAPFAQAREFNTQATTRRTTTLLVERVLAHAADRGVRRVIPCQMLGNGVEIQPDEALAIREMLKGTGASDALARQLANKVRAPGTIATRAVQELWPKLVRLGIID